MTGILGRYLSAAIVKHYLLFAALTLTVVSLVQFLENRDGLLDRPELTAADALAFSALGAPAVYSMLAGFIAILASLVAAMGLVRHSELKALLAAGPSYGQLLRALAPAAIILAGIHFLMDNLTLPAAAAALRERGMGGTGPEEPRRVWLREGNHVIAIGGINRRERALERLELFTLDRSSGRVTSLLSAPRGVIRQGRLEIPHGRRIVAGQVRGTAVRGFSVPVRFDLDMVSVLTLHPRQSPAWQIARALGAADAGADRRHVLRLWLARKVAAPLSTALLVLLVAPLAQAAQRLGGVRLLTAGLAAGFVCFVADAVAAGLGESGVIAPDAAAWALPAALSIAIIWPALVAAGDRR